MPKETYHIRTDSSIYVSAEEESGEQSGDEKRPEYLQADDHSQSDASLVRPFDIIRHPGAGTKFSNREVLQLLESDTYITLARADVSTAPRMI